jgi:ATP-dependent Clp protease adapter protein ClpS
MPEVIDRPNAPVALPQRAPTEELLTEKPPMYAVVLHNDESTDPTFVIEVLCQVFAYDEQKAIRVMMQIHLGAEGVVVVLSQELAETKCAQAMALVASAGRNAKNSDRPCELTFTTRKE